ncbi:hypothetical protein B0H14DRAFT_2567433 [Mycena olivaceomarginata]|nr:hypothetical protein B0H14DRAFT_2567433 [Mycena olivaceomarginata]
MIAHQDPVGDWERGAMGGQDFWGRADELLDKKRKREIDGESGFSDGARDACSQPAGMLSSEGREGPPSVQNLSVSGPVLTNSKSMHFPRQQGHTFENTKDCSDRNRVTRLKMSRITVRWTPPNAIEPGTVKVLSKAKRFTESWKTTLLAQTGTIASTPLLVPKSRAYPVPGYFLKRPRAIMIPEGSILNQGALLLIELFLVSDVNDDRFKMPLLLNTGETVLVKQEVCLCNRTYPRISAGFCLRPGFLSRTVFSP